MAGWVGRVGELLQRLCHDDSTTNIVTSIIINSAEEVVYSKQSARMCVCVCAQNILKTYEQILMKFFGRMGCGPRINRLDFGGDLSPIPYCHQLCNALSTE